MGEREEIIEEKAKENPKRMVGPHSHNKSKKRTFFLSYWETRTSALAKGLLKKGSSLAALHYINTEFDLILQSTDFYNIWFGMWTTTVSALQLINRHLKHKKRQTLKIKKQKIQHSLQYCSSNNNPPGFPVPNHKPLINVPFIF